MRKKYILNEDIEDISIVDEPVESAEIEKVSAETKRAEDLGISSMFSSLIQDEWKTIDAYKSTLATLLDIGGHEGEIKVLEDIIAEETMHVGQLESCVNGVAPESSENLEAGKDEAETQLAETESPVDESKAKAKKRPIREAFFYNSPYGDSFSYWMDEAKAEIDYLRDEYTEENDKILDVPEDKIEALCTAVAQDILDDGRLWEIINEKIRDYIYEHVDEFQPQYNISIDGDHL